MTKDIFDKMNNYDLLEAYTALVKEHHYSPCETPEHVMQLLNMGLNQYSCHDEIMRRMSINERS